MDRSDLFNVNAGIVKNLVQQVAKTCPKACIGIITNPVNTTVAIAAEVLKKAGVYDKNKLFGVTAGHHPLQHLCCGTERQAAWRR
jgi:malate dehydrogenase